MPQPSTDIAELQAQLASAHERMLKAERERTHLLTRAVTAESALASARAELAALKEAK